MLEASVYVVGLGVLYWYFDKESRKSVDEHTRLANKIFESADGAIPSDKVLLQLQQNLNAAKTQRSMRNIELLIFLMIVGFLVDAFGVAYWQR